MDLFVFVQGNKLIELLQYGVVYFFLAIFGGALIDNFLPAVRDSKSTVKLAFEIFVHIMANIILIFYMVKFARLLPLITGKDSSTSMYSGGAAISLGLMGSQGNLKRKIKILTDQISQQLFSIRDHPEDDHENFFPFSQMLFRQSRKKSAQMVKV